MKRRFVVPLMVMLVMGVVACATFEKNTYRTLYTAGTTYDMSMVTVATLQKTGIINAENRKEIDKLANIFYVSYHSSVDAFELWKRTGTPENKNKAQTALMFMFQNWRTYAAYVNRLRPNTLPPELEEVK